MSIKNLIHTETDQNMQPIITLEFTFIGQVAVTPIRTQEGIGYATITIEDTIAKINKILIYKMDVSEKVFYLKKIPNLQTAIEGSKPYTACVDGKYSPSDALKYMVLDENKYTFPEVTQLLGPDSVVMKDPGKNPLRQWVASIKENIALYFPKVPKS